MGRILIIVGVVFIVFGLATHLGLGRLPGDVTVKGNHFTLYFPIVSSVIISILLTIILNIFLRR